MISPEVRQCTLLIGKVLKSLWQISLFHLWTSDGYNCMESSRMELDGPPTFLWQDCQTSPLYTASSSDSSIFKIPRMSTFSTWSSDLLKVNKIESPLFAIINNPCRVTLNNSYRIVCQCKNSHLLMLPTCVRKSELVTALTLRIF